MTDAIVCDTRSAGPRICTDKGQLQQLRFPAHDELGTCKASRVSPEQSVVSIPMRSNDAFSTLRSALTESSCREGSDEEAEPGREDEEDDESANMTNR